MTPKGESASGELVIPAVSLVGMLLHSSRLFGTLYALNRGIADSSSR